MIDEADRVIQAFYGISSPWAYLGAPQLAEIARRRNVRVVLRPIRIIEDNGGIPLRTRPTARQDYHEVELKRWRVRLNMPLNLKPRYYPCRTIELAAQAVIAAQMLGKDAFDLSFAIQRGLWAEDRDIADPATLDAFWHETFGTERGDEVSAQRAAEAVTAWDDNLDEALRLGIFGTPTYVFDGELYWGQDRLFFIDEILSEIKETA